jgi:hypothetical protein
MYIAQKWVKKNRWSRWQFYLSMNLIHKPLQNPKKKIIFKSHMFAFLMLNLNYNHLFTIIILIQDSLQLKRIMSKMKLQKN